MHEHEGRTATDVSLNDGGDRAVTTAVGRRTRVEEAAASSRAAGPQPPSPPKSDAGPFGQPLASAVQRRVANGGGKSDGSALATAKDGVKGPASSLPHLEEIQASFGRHDVSGVRSHTGGEAKAAATAIGASAYATGNDVAFGQTPDLHTAAHEAAHVVQQRAGVQLYGGVGREGDEYEKHADAVADRVVSGDSAEDLLDRMPGGGGGGGVQRAVQKAPPTEEPAVGSEGDKGEEESSEHAAWALEKLKAIRGVRASVAASRKKLKSDSSATISALREAKVVFREFEKRHRKAKAAFEAQIEAHLEKAQMIRDNVSFLLTTVLGMIPYTRLVTAMALSSGAVKSVSSALKVARAVKTAEKVAGAAGKVKGAAGKAEKIAGLGAVGDVKAKPKPPPKPANLDWEVLVDAALESFEQYVASTAGLDGLDTDCDSVIDGLTDTALGMADHGPDSSVGNRAKALLSMGDISSKAAAPKAKQFLAVVKEKLEATTYLDIQQQMGIAWVAALGDNNLEAIADCKYYLRGINVIGPNSKTGLNIRSDEGMIDMMTDGEKQMVKWRAQIKIEGDRAVGRRASWLGGRKIGRHVIGRIEYAGREYAASGPAAPRDDICYVPGRYLPEEKSGGVLIDKAEFDEGIVESTENGEAKLEKDYKAGLRGAMHFSVLPTETAHAGGNSVDSSGPEVSSNE